MKSRKVKIIHTKQDGSTVTATIKATSTTHIYDVFLSRELYKKGIPDYLNSAIENYEGSEGKMMVSGLLTLGDLEPEKSKIVLKTSSIFNQPSQQNDSEMSQLDKKFFKKFF